MENNALIQIEKPIGLDASFASAGSLTQPLVPSVADNTGQAEAPQQIDLNNLFTDDVRQSIMSSAMSAPLRNAPNESKFVDKSLTSRYEGRPVSYNDIGLDTAYVDAKYSKTQSIFETTVNNLKVGGANLGAMFISSFLGIGDIVNNIAQNKGATDSDLQESLFQFREGVANNNINFQNEQDQKTDAWSTIANILIPTYFTGATTGWGSIFENAMFGVGAGAGLATQELIVGALTGGVGNSLVTARFAANLLNNIDRIKKTLTIADRIYDSSVTLNNVRKTMDITNKVMTGAKWGYRMGVGAHGEAAFEGLETKHQMTESLRQQYYNQYGYNPTGKDLENITRITNEMAQTRYLANLALLSVSNGMQFQRLFRGFDLAKESSEQLAKQGLRVGFENGAPVAKEVGELTSDWWNRGFQKNLKSAAQSINKGLKGDLLKESFSEGTEEFLQLGIDNSVNEYSKWKLNHAGQHSINAGIKAIQEGLGATMNTKGLGAWVSGAISGVAQQAAYGAMSGVKNRIDPNGITRTELSAKQKAELSNTLSVYKGFNVETAFDAFNVNSVRNSATGRVMNANAASVATMAADSALKNNDPKLYRDAKSVDMFSLVEPYAARGHSDILIEQFKFSLESLEDSELAEMFGAPISKNEAILKFTEEVKKVENSYNKIKGAFRNPYAPNDLRYRMFERDFIPELAFLNYRTDELNRRRNEIQSSLGNYYDEFKWFSDAKDLSKGKSYLQDQIKEITAIGDSLKLLPSPNVDDRIQYNKQFELAKQYSETLSLLEDFESTDNDREAYDEFLESLHQSMITKLERNDVGFYNKDEVMQKITDFNRIVTDLDRVETLLKGYLSKDGFQTFSEGLASYAKKEQSKREKLERSADVTGATPEIKQKYPELSDEQIETILSESISVDQVNDKIKNLVEEIREKEARDRIIIDAITAEFIKQKRGDLVTAYLSNATLSNLAKDLAEAKQYLKDVSDADYLAAHDAILNALVLTLSPLGDFNKEKLTAFVNDGNFHPDNKTLYDTLSDEQKLVFAQNVLQALQAQKKLTKGAQAKVYDIDIKLYKALIKELKKTIPKQFVPSNEEYNGYIINHETKTKSSYSKDGKYVNTTHPNKVKAEIDALVKEESSKVDPAEVTENNLENKFENGYWNPEWYDDNGVRIEQDSITDLRAELNDEFNNKSEDQISDMIAKNSEFKFYDAKDLNAPAILTPLRQEPILTSVAKADHIVLSYKLPNGKLVPLNTFKRPTQGLRFMDEKTVDSILSTVKDRVLIKQAIVNAGYDWYTFVRNSTSDSRVFDALRAEGMITFKGTAQQQLDYLVAANEKFNKMSTKPASDFKFTRIHYGVETKNVSVQPLRNVQYPYAMLSGEDDTAYAFRTFVKIPKGYTHTNPKGIKVLGVPDDLHPEVETKVKQALISLYGDRTIFGGYYMLITDSKGMPVVYKLVGNKVTDDRFSEIVKNAPDDGKQVPDVAIIDSTNRLDIDIKKKGNLLSVLITDTYTAETYTDATGKKVIFEGNKKYLSIDPAKDDVKSSILKGLARDGWKGKDDKDISVSFDTRNTALSFVQSTSTTPTTIEEFMDTRSVSINPQNFMVKKVVVTEKNDAPLTPSSAPVQQGISFEDLFGTPVVPSAPIAPVITNEEIEDEDPNLTDEFAWVNDLAATLGIDMNIATIFPQGITSQDVAVMSYEISKLLNNSLPGAVPLIWENVAKIIIIGANAYSVKNGGNWWLNDLETIKASLPQIQMLVNKVNNKGIVQQAFRQANIANMFTKRSTPKTRVSVEDKVKEIIKQCI